jgi:hypothetical protein
LALLLAVARFVLDSEAATANLVTSESVTSMAEAKKTDYPSAMALLAVARQYLEGAEIIFAQQTAFDLSALLSLFSNSRELAQSLFEDTR